MNVTCIPDLLARVRRVDGPSSPTPWSGGQVKGSGDPLGGRPTHGGGRAATQFWVFDPCAGAFCRGSRGET